MLRKQTQTNPIQTQFKPKQTQYKPNSNPITKRPKMNVTSLLLTTNDQRLATREAQNKPKQTQCPCRKSKGAVICLYGRNRKGTGFGYSNGIMNLLEND